MSTKSVVVLIGISVLMSAISCNFQSSIDGSRNTVLALTNLDKWEFYSAVSEVCMEDVFSSKDGSLACKGLPLGYLYTKGDYANFILKLEWRWPTGKEAGKGGILMRMTGDHKIWPKSLEAQINAGSAGDFWGLAGYQLSGPTDRLSSLKHEKFGDLINIKKMIAAEKPTGEWNTYEITATGDTVTLKINKQLVNQATNCEITPGKICLTSEGSPIEFRNIHLQSLHPNTPNPVTP